MASSVLVNVKEEVTCPICLELMMEPVSTDCGHSFCKLCITANCESTVHEQGVSTCPVCRVAFQFERLRPNRQVASIVEMLRGLTLIPEAEHCERHGEKLLLFCKDDGKVICWLCERSQEHRGHHISLMEEVAKEHEEKLHKVLKKLMKDEKEFEKLKADIEEERTSWKNQIQWEIENVQTVFKQLRVTLDAEENRHLEKLTKEEERILNSLAESDKELTQQTQLVRECISDVQSRLQGSVMEKLQVKDPMERSKLLTPKKPRTFPRTKRMVLQAPDLKGMLQMHQELMEVRRHWVSVTLAPSNNQDTGNSAFWRNGRRIQANDGFQTWNSHSGFLGSPAITSGKHYWEVDVTKDCDWFLGVSDRRCLNTVFNNSVSRYQPQLGYWVIGQQNNVNYKAFDEIYNSDPLTLALSLTVPPKRVGVFLDYGARTVSFYNVTNHGFLIYKFSNCSFSGNVFPFFSPRMCTVPAPSCEPRV